MFKFIRERQLRFIEEFMAGVGVVENWRTDQAVVPVRFCELKIELNMTQGDVGQQFSEGLNRLASQLIGMRQKFDMARKEVQFPNTLTGDATDGDES